MSATVVAAGAVQASEEINEALSWGIGGLTLGILLALLLGLVFFGGGRDHT
jgi:high-affinity Fe2+/Pb2+ permease